MATAPELQMIIVSLVLLVPVVAPSSNGQTNRTITLEWRQPPALSLRRFLDYEDTMCQTENGFNGTCLNRIRCYASEGTASGSCAFGFGVCCFVSKSCGKTTMNNNTYFTGPNSLKSGAGVCTLQLIKPRVAVCQYRLDFHEFNLSPPNKDGECTVDRFIVPSSVTPVPTLCGNNKGQHIYLHVGLSTSTTSLTVASLGTFSERMWNIQITQISCDSPVRAPEGCLQYYSESMGRIMSFNWESENKGIHLANLEYGICFRNIPGFCSVCLEQCPQMGSFSIDGDQKSDNNYNSKRCNKDFLMIPCGSMKYQPPDLCPYSRFCGGTLNAPVLTSSTDPKKEGTVSPMEVCTSQKPFTLTFKTDGNEIGDGQSSGFCLVYNQRAC